jgi:hypothetical protein
MNITQNTRMHWITQHLMGGLRLAAFDPAGINRFQDDTRSLWLSFAAPIASVPLLLWLQTLQGLAQDVTVVDMLRDILGYAVSVFGFPLVMHYVIGFMAPRERLNLLVVAVNWAAPWQAAALALAVGVGMLPGVPDGFGSLLLFIASLFNVIYIWFAIRVALGTGRGRAIGVLAIITLLQLAGWLLTQLGT